jgi:lipopolysaccharide assembly outer membrane protein LptD (OstA)
LPFKLLTDRLLRGFLLFAFLWLRGTMIAGGFPAGIGNPFPAPQIVAVPDTTISQEVDTLALDTLIGPKSSSALDAEVKYSASDSLWFDFKAQKAFLVKNAEIYYQDITLKADYIEIDFEKTEIYATGLPDSNGKMTGLPVFTQGDQTFTSHVMRYNYKSKKGFIEKVVTEDGSGYLHGESVKKMGDDIVNISKGSYTTCNNLEDPHFEFRYNKSIIVPKKRIVTGPAYLTVEGVPTPLCIPFGFFPTKQNQRSGIVLPTYGESANRGFYFENGGYYQYINDYFDFQVLGDIYTKGSWAVKPTFRYKKRYKFSGNLALTYAINIEGVKETPNYSRSKDFAIRWSHRQDPKARPKSMFSADVNIVSNTYNKYNPTTTQDYLSNTFRSSIAYQTNFAGKYFLNLTASHDQNTISHVVNVTLPELTFNVNRFNPFQSKHRTGPAKWYENITMNYTMNAKNQVTMPDSLFFTGKTLENMKNGIRHALPINSPIKILKFFNWTNSINLNDRMYFESYRQYWSNDTLISGGDTIVGYMVKDTINGFNNVFDFTYSSTVNTKLYGIIQFGKNFPVRAIRHVMTPSVSFAYSPDFSSDFWGYYDTYINADGDEVTYSKYTGTLYGGPGQGRSGRLSFNVSNNLEMKIRSRKDTITGTKKIPLIDNFTVGFGYDFTRDSLNWSPLALSGRTRLFKNIDISYRSEFDPYILDSAGTRNLNQTEWQVNHRLLRLKQTNWSVSINYRMNSNDFKKKSGSSPPTTPALSQNSQVSQEEMQDIIDNPDQYIDWSIPWDLTFSYSFNYTAIHRYNDYVLNNQKTVVQTLGVSGNISITPKWKIGFMTGWDFEDNDLSYTSLNFYRDLHCWEMRFNWIPVGFRKSWNFTINAKASILQDMKLNKKKDFRDF